jgi:hypothetical protein
MKGGYTDTDVNRKIVKSIFKELIEVNKISYATPLIVNGKITKQVKMLHPDKIRILSPTLQKLPNLFDNTFGFLQYQQESGIKNMTVGDIFENKVIHNRNIVSDIISYGLTDTDVKIQQLSSMAYTLMYVLFMNPSKFSVEDVSRMVLVANYAMNKAYLLMNSKTMKGSGKSKTTRSKKSKTKRGKKRKTIRSKKKIKTSKTRYNKQGIKKSKRRRGKSQKGGMWPFTRAKTSEDISDFEGKLVTKESGEKFKEMVVQHINLPAGRKNQLVKIRARQALFNEKQAESMGLTSQSVDISGLSVQDRIAATESSAKDKFNFTKEEFEEAYEEQMNLLDESVSSISKKVFTSFRVKATKWEQERDLIKSVKYDELEILDKKVAIAKNVLTFGGSISYTVLHAMMSYPDMASKVISIENIPGQELLAPQLSFITNAIFTVFLISKVKNAGKGNLILSLLSSLILLLLVIHLSIQSWNQFGGLFGEEEVVVEETSVLENLSSSFSGFWNKTEKESTSETSWFNTSSILMNSLLYPVKTAASIGINTSIMASNQVSNLIDKHGSIVTYPLMSTIIGSSILSTGSSIIDLRRSNRSLQSFILEKVREHGFNYSEFENMLKGKINSDTGAPSDFGGVQQAVADELSRQSAVISDAVRQAQMSLQTEAQLRTAQAQEVGTQNTVLDAETREIMDALPDIPNSEDVELEKRLLDLKKIDNEQNPVAA